MQPWLVVDIETRIDMSLLNRSEYRGVGLTDVCAYHRFQEKMLVESQGRSDFISCWYHRPISIAVGIVDPDLKLANVMTLGSRGLRGDDAEEAMVEHFWKFVNQGCTLVTFNGFGFDLPVLEHAAMRYGIQARDYWRGKARNRYSEEGHLDLQPFYSNNGAAPIRGGLNMLALSFRYPGKGEVSGKDVQRLYDAGEIEKIHTYCRGDVVTTYLLFIRLQLARGLITPDRFAVVEREAVAMLEELDVPIPEDLPF